MLNTIFHKHIKQYEFKDQHQETLGASSSMVVTKAIYFVKMGTLFDGNEDVHKLSALELYSVQDTLRFNRFIVKAYIQA